MAIPTALRVPTGHDDSVELAQDCVLHLLVVSHQTQPVHSTKMQSFLLFCSLQMNTGVTWAEHRAMKSSSSSTTARIFKK